VNDWLQFFTAVCPVGSDEKYVPNKLRTLYCVCMYVCMISGLYVIFRKSYHVVIQLAI
jgi:hypothetical protein